MSCKAIVINKLLTILSNKIVQRSFIKKIGATGLRFNGNCTGVREEAFTDKNNFGYWNLG